MSARPALTSALVASCVALGACGGGGGEDTTADTGPATQPGATTGAECRKVPEPAPRPAPDLPAPSLRLDPATTYRAVVQTNCGSFTITLDVRNSPKTSASFVSLARANFYDGLTFHRIVPRFVIQGGDPRGDGAGDPGYSVVEPPPRNVRYTRGVVAMAKTESDAPGTSGSQFYVVSGADAQLPPDYALLGMVNQGQEVVDRIDTQPLRGGADPTTAERPASPIVISDIAVQER